MTAIDLPVHYPYGGYHYLLHWYSDEDRGHLILARNEYSISVTAKRVFDEHPDAEIKAYCTIDIVGPSRLMRVLAAVERRQENIRRFHREIAHHMKDAHEAGLKLPPMFVLCEKFEPQEDHGDPSDFALETHYDCRHCLDTIRLVGLTPAILYDRYYAAWLNMHPKHNDNHHRPDHTRVPSRAHPARDGEALLCVRPRFGHHSDGLILQPISPKSEPDTLSDAGYTHSYLDGNTLFFFRHRQDIDHAGLQAILDEAKAKDHARSERYNRERKEKFDREHREEYEQAVLFFVEMTK